MTRQLNAGDKATICIGLDIKITLVEVKGDQVRIGVQAPRSVTVDRTKIWEQKRQERQSEALFEASPSELKADRVQ